MHSRLFNITVIAIWLGTMSWLLVSKVLPPLWVGDPPNYRSIVTAEENARPEPVCWSIHWNDELLGWAVSEVVPIKDGMTELQGRVYFGDVPLNEMVPRLLEPLVQPIVRQFGSIDLDARSRVEIDPLGRLTGFDSHVRLATLKDAVRVQGRVDGSQLKLSLQWGESLYRTERTLPPDALVGDELSPLAQLPGLKLGQAWTMPVYSPLRPGRDTMEILHAKVERHEPLIWNGKSVDTLLVVYRPDPGATLLASPEPRSRLWVASNGFVLQQEVTVLNSRLQFVRLSPDHSERMVELLGPAFAAELADGTGDNMFKWLKDTLKHAEQRQLDPAAAADPSTNQP